MRYVPFEEATPETYAALGFMSGLEIHQQILTQKKLFCRCPAGIYSSAWDAEILRHMRPTLSEMGEYDGTALMEFKTRKNIVYRIKKETVCTYEFDDTPPFMINQEALEIALSITMLLKCSLISEIHISRKQYLDGSIPTGFQRTTILGVDGGVPYKGRTIRIRQLGLEEDACREVSDSGHMRTYLTDRLGMPLIETVTEPDMRTPREVADVAQLLRRLVRSTGTVRTGLGAGREDVNVSVAGGTRIEIKGVPRIPRIPLLVHNEAFRQSALLDIREELKARGITPECFQAETKDLTAQLKGTRYSPIHVALENGGVVLGVRLCGFAGILARATQPGTLFLREFSDRVRVVACLDFLPNLVCSDATEGSLTPAEWNQVRRVMGATGKDTVVAVWGPPEDVRLAANEVRGRALEALKGVPSETRQALADGTNGFERILPGPDRMYPDTDHPPMPLEDERIRRVRSALPPPPWEREERYLALGLAAPVAVRLSASPRAGLFEQAVAGGTEPAFAVRVLMERMRALRRRGLDARRVGRDFLLALFAAQREGRIVRDAAGPLLAAAAKGAGDVEASVRELGLAPAGAPEIEQAVEAAVPESRERKFRTGAARERFLMGAAMRTLRGRAEGKTVLAALRPRLAPMA
ncbi:MAG: Glu-tRNA(Gln) amidotransferase subunit GatE [Planctomycetes bacterium]|nr:Glu-tRNA(Gln) amidotransferase subunit GatE [Planctomycetota bacterium]